MKAPLAAAAQPLASISPSAFEVMRACRLAYAFARASSPSARPTAPVLLGAISHAALGDLAQSRAILSDGWQRELEARWEAAVEAAADELAAHDGGRALSPCEWDGYEIKRARLRKAAGRLHDLLAPLGQSADLIVERPLTAAEGRLRGCPDLIVRAGEVLWLLDYKTGAAVSRDTRELHESYVRQLQLYAYLVSQSLGRWPERALLVPLQGEIVDVEVEQEHCDALAREALELLAAFNSTAPAIQPASPTPDNCRWCAHAAECPAFWSGCDEEWAPVVLAAAGTARSVLRAGLGGVSLTVEAEQGSVGRRALGVRAVSLEDHPAIAAAHEGSDVAFVGLRADRDSTSYTLPAYGRVAVWPP